MREHARAICPPLRANSRSVTERGIKKPTALGEIVEHRLQLARMLVRQAGNSAQGDGSCHGTLLQGAPPIELVGSFVGRAVRRHACRLRCSGLPDILHEALALFP